MSYLATGDVTVRLEGAKAPAVYAAPVVQPEHNSEDSLAMMRGEMTLSEAADRRQARLDAKEAARQAEKPVPEPWDAWRTQKAPEMFEPEVTRRG